MRDAKLFEALPPVTDSTTGIGGAEITFSAHATVKCTVRYGEQQIVTSVIV